VRTDNSTRIDILLAEFRAVREEITSRSAAQGVLLNLAIFSSGAVAGFVITTPDVAPLALVLCFTSSFLGALWLDHARVITVLGTFTLDTLWPQLRELAQANLATHEDWARSQEKHRLGWLVFVGPVMAIFVLPAIAGLVYSFPVIAAVESRGAWAIWLMAATVTGGSVAYWTAYFLNDAVLTRPPQAYKGELAALSLTDSAHQKPNAVVGGEADGAEPTGGRSSVPSQRVPVE
jgi:hypothetical protein